jgi:hypothetical protein
MLKGDHIRADRSWYFHHGIDAGDGMVIHLSGEPGRTLGAKVVCCDWDEFSRGSPVEVVASGARFPADEIVTRAESRIGETGYDLLFKNCERFARWCRNGKAQSLHVERAALHGVGLGLAARAGASLLARRAGLAALAPVLGPVGTAITLAATGILIAAQMSK